MKPLHTIPLHISSTVREIHGDSWLVQRLHEMGLFPGATITVVRRAPFGGPMEIMLQSRSIGLRLSDGVSVMVEAAPHA